MTAAPVFALRPLLVRAWRFDPNAAPPAWLEAAMDEGLASFCSGLPSRLTVFGRRGSEAADPGDFICRPIAGGDLFVCPADEFDGCCERVCDLPDTTGEAPQ